MDILYLIGAFVLGAIFHKSAEMAWDWLKDWYRDKTDPVDATKPVDPTPAPTPEDQTKRW